MHCRERTRTGDDVRFERKVNRKMCVCVRGTLANGRTREKKMEKRNGEKKTEKKRKREQMGEKNAGWPWVPRSVFIEGDPSSKKREKGQWTKGTPDSQRKNEAKLIQLI